MADLYSKLQGVAGDLLTRFNQPTITLIKITPGTGTPANPGLPVEVSHVLTGAVAKGASAYLIAQKIANAGDLLVTMKATEGVEPTLKDAVLVDGKRFRIVEVKKVPASGTVIVYKLQVRM